MVIVSPSSPTATAASGCYRGTAMSSRQFGPVFADLARLGRQVVLDGEIAAPDERGVTHLDDLSAAMQRRDTAGLALLRLRPLAARRP